MKTIIALMLAVATAAFSQDTPAKLPTAAIPTSTATPVIVTFNCTQGFDESGAVDSAHFNAYLAYFEANAITGNMESRNAGMIQFDAMKPAGKDSISAGGATVSYAQLVALINQAFANQKAVQSPPP